MRKTIIALSILTGVMAACGPKASKTPVPPPMPPSEAMVTGESKAGGLLIASAKCTKCHSDKSEHVPKHTFEEQEKLMQAMAKKAKLTPEETAHLMTYVKANAKKS